MTTAKVKIKMIDYGPSGHNRPGQERTVSKAEADRLIESGSAALVKSAPKKAK